MSNITATTTEDAAHPATGARGKGRVAMASMIGTAFEWYDFTVYNTMAALVFGKLFFPSFDPMVGTILAFSTYAVGYISRPIGGVIFGQLGDKLGRRAVLVLTLLLMGVTTIAMGLLPTYQQWGIAAPLLLVSFRFLQGIALGGGWAGAVLLSVEHGKPEQRGLNASWPQVGPSLGTLMGTFCIYVISTMVSDENFLSWGWRIPFILSVIVVLFGFWVRIGIEETPVFKNLEKTSMTAKTPVRDVLVLHWRRLLVAGGCRIGSDVLYGLIVVFTLTYVTTILNLPRSLAIFAVMVGTGVNAAIVPLFGILSDKIGRRVTYGLGAVGAIIWTFVYFILLDTANPVMIVVATVGGLVFHAVMYGPQAAFVIEQFPSRVRYSGASLAYTFAGVVGGGFAPLIIASLFQAYAGWLAVSFYVVGTLCITLIAVLSAREMAGKPMPE